MCSLKFDKKNIIRIDNKPFFKGGHSILTVKRILSVAIFQEKEWLPKILPIISEKYI